MIQTCEFKVLGNPVGKGRPRFTKTGHTYTPTKTREYEKQVAQAAWVAMQHGHLKPTDRRVSLIVAAYFEIPKSYSKKKTIECQAGILIPKRPDFDNISKAVADACNQIVYLDDGQVWHHTIFKRYCDVGQDPHIHVKIEWDDPSKNNLDHNIHAIS